MKPEERVYESFFYLKERKLYYSQIKEQSDLSHSSLQRVLEKLKKMNILEEEKTKANVFYKIKDKKVFSLKFSEIAVKKFNNLSYNVKTPLINFLRNLPVGVYTIVLFGSTARGEETSKSDIDILLVSENKIAVTNNKREAELTSKYPISIFQVNTIDFMENMDDVVMQARRTGFPIHKEQNFYEVILDAYR